MSGGEREEGEMALKNLMIREHDNEQPINLITERVIKRDGSRKCIQQRRKSPVDKIWETGCKYV